ncbi:MAG TPA: hypothetical protein VNA66_09955, partial [Gammaproteobacteria bacterium]|nr:hypothetical protein [Gammaproteobacteria bacterium]
MNVRQSAAIALLVAVLPLAGVGVMMTNDAMRIRQLERRCVENVQATERYVDIGVRLSVVVADDAGEALVEGAPLLRVVGKPMLFGGLLDTRANP